MLKNTILKFFIFLFLLGVLCQPVSAEIGGVFPDFTWDARYLSSSLNGVYLDTPFSVIESPAYSSHAENRIGIEQKDIFGMKFTSLGVTVGNYGSYLIINQSPEGLGFNYNTFRWGNVYSYRINNFSFGIKVDLLYLSVTDIEDQSDYSASGYNIDLGFDYRKEVSDELLDELFLYFTPKNISNRLEYSTGTTEEVARREFNYGGGVVFNGLTFGININQTSSGDRNINTGLDYKFENIPTDIVDKIFMGAGYDSDHFSLGFGMEYRGYRINYGRTFEGRDSDQSISASFSF